MIEGVRDLYPTDDVALPAVVSNLDGDPTAVTVSAVESSSGGYRAKFFERYDGRVLDGTAFAVDGVVVLLSVGIPEQDTRDHAEAAQRLDAMEDSIALMAPDPAARCVGSGG